MDEITQNCKDKMEKVIANLKDSLKTIRSGVVTPNALDKIFVDYYGEKTSIKALASVTVSSATQLVVRPFDPNSIRSIAGAIGESNLGVSPVINGSDIRVTFPQLTGERRLEYVKQAKAYCEQAKVSVRSVRADAINKVKKDKELSKDMVFNYTNDIQDLTNKFNKQIEEIFAKKEKELTTL
ncbi:MAG: ribosome recycling factor [Bacilli bacterium]